MESIKINIAKNSKGCEIEESLARPRDEMTRHIKEVEEFIFRVVSKSSHITRAVTEPLNGNTINLFVFNYYANYFALLNRLCNLYDGRQIRSTF